MMGWAALEHYAYAAVAVLGTLAAVMAIARVAQLPRLQPTMASFRGVAGPFMGVAGTLFGLTLAFIANDTWAARDKATDAVFQEAESLRSLLILTEALPPLQGSALAAAVRDYGNAAGGEWKALRDARDEPGVAHAADTLLRVTSAPAVQEVAGQVIGQALLQNVTELRQARDGRVALTRTHLNPLKWLGMALLGFLTMLSIVAVHLDNMRAGMLAVILFALAAAPSSAVVLLQGNPFQEPAAVSPKWILDAVALPDTGASPPP